MKPKKFAKLTVAFFLVGTLAAPIAQAATFHYDGWQLPAGAANGIYPANFTTTTDETSTWIRVTARNAQRDITVRNLNCTTGAAVSGWTDYLRNEFGYKTVWSGATGCVKYQAGVYGPNGLIIGGDFKY